MAEDWQEIIIRPGVETLLNTIAEEKEVSVLKLSAEIGVSEARIKKWAEKLNDHSLIEANFSASEGTKLGYTAANKDAFEEMLERLQDMEPETGDENRRAEKAEKKIESHLDHLENLDSEKNRDWKKIFTRFLP